MSQTYNNRNTVEILGYFICTIRHTRILFNIAVIGFVQYRNILSAFR